MALELDYCRTATTADCLTVTITDQTGDYDAVDNPGGYGTPNPDRADLALFLYGWKWVSPDADDPEDIPLVIDNTDPINVTEWQIEESLDGYYYYKLFAVPVWDIATAYVIDDVVYDSTYQEYYKAIAPSTGSQPGDNPANWEVVDNLIEEEENESLTVQLYNDAITCRAEACWSQVLSDYSDQCCKDCDGLDICSQWIKTDALLQAAFMNIYQEKWREADYILSTLKDLCADVDCSVC
jgi:hypothetical protein